MRNWLYALLFVFVVSGCNSKSDSMTNEEKIAGKEEKTWKAQRETDASGDKDKLTRDEKRQTVTLQTGSCSNCGYPAIRVDTPS